MFQSQYRKTMVPTFWNPCSPHRVQTKILRFLFGLPSPNLEETFVSTFHERC